MVMEVKADREVGLAYMKSWESEKRIKEKKKAEAIYTQTDMDVLNQWLLLAAGAGNVEEFINGMHSGTGRCPKTVE